MVSKVFGWSQSFYRSPTGRHFYGTENEVFAGFGPINNTEKNNWADYEVGFFMFLYANVFLKNQNIVAFRVDPESFPCIIRGGILQ